MNGLAHIQLVPLGKRLQVQPGTPLQEVLFDQGVEFPCGGRGRCKGCRVKVLHGAWPATAQEAQLLSVAELEAGWRLACQGQASGDLTLELAQWEAPVLGDESRFDFVPQSGLGVAVDVGTTTLAAQLLDLSSGHVLAVGSALNAQAQHGADVMSRIDFALSAEGQTRLQQLIRQQIGNMVAQLLNSAARSPAQLRHVVLVGNTVMHHLFCGVSVAPLACHPFQPADDGLKVFRPTDLGWEDLTQADVAIRFLPSLGGFVGSDILAGLLATRLYESPVLGALVDLGTNGEIVVGNRERLLCASTAAGPAFEGACISMGMRAATGAIAEVIGRDGALHCRVLGSGPPRGVCGSGLVDAVAAALELGWIDPAGRLVGRHDLRLAGSVRLSARDVREVQLAKGAIAAGLQLLVRVWGAALEDIHQVHLAGAFGNYINRTSARRIGLLPFEPEKVVPAGNTALRGAKLALFGLSQGDGSYAELRRKVRHVALNQQPLFHQVYAQQMRFGP